MSDNGYTIAQAYIQIMPSMDKFGSAIKGDITSEGEEAASRFSSGFQKGMKVIGTTVAAAAAAVSGVVAASTREFANYEQLVGGVQKLFGDMDYQAVVDNANQAFETAGLSANEYMETVTSFSASLISSLSGDTKAAAEYADTAITDMSDNANVFGSNMQDIQNAYQGFAKQNYTMLDNLKLGYGGTKTEMERLVTDAEKLNSTFKATRDENGNLTLSFADVVEAIHIVQENMNITGTTSREASKTVEGSVNAMKAAWKNLLAGMGNSNADISKLVGDFSGSIETALDNILPVVQTSITSISQALPELIGNLLPKLVQLVTNMLPDLINAATELINGLISALPSIVSGIVEVLPGLIENVFSNIGSIAGNLLPALAESLISIFANLPAMLAGAVGGIVEGISNLITGIVDEVKYQAEASIPDDLSEGYVGKIKSNFEKTFADGMLNLQGTIANLIGDQDWADTVAGLKLASQLQDKIIDDYNSVMQEMSQYSFENFQLETEANVNTAMSLLGALEGMIDENGNITGSLEVAQTYIDQINGILGEGAVTLEETPADWILQIADKYQDADGNITDPESLRSEIENELNKIFGNEEAIDLNKQTYNAVSEVLSGYTEEEALADKEEIKADIEAKLQDAGIPETTAKAIANAAVEDGAITTWFNTSPSTSWDNSAFISWMQDNDYLPGDGETIPIDELSVIVSAYVSGEIDAEEFNTKIESLNLPDNIKEQTIQYTVNYSQVDEAIKAFEELKQKQYETALTKIFVDANIENMRMFTDAIREAAEAEGKFEDGISNLELTEYNEHLNTATLSLNAQKEEAEQMYGTLWDLNGALQEHMTKEQYISDMLSNDTAYQLHTQELQELRAAEADYAAQLIESAGGYSKLSSANKDLVFDLIASTDSFENMGTILGTTTEQTGILADVIGGYMREFGAGTQKAHQELWNWAQTSSEASEIADTLGISTQTLAGILYGLVDNENLVAASTEEMATAYDEAQPSVDELGDTVSAAAVDIDAAADSVSASSQIIETAVTESLDNASANVANSDLPTQVETLFNDIDPAEMQAALSTLGYTSMNELINAITEQGIVAADTVGDVESDMADQMAELSGDMATAGDEGGSSLDSGFAGWKSFISGTVDDTYNYFYQTLGQTLPPLMSTWGSNSGQKFNSGLKLWKTDVSSTADDYALNVKTPLQSLATSLHMIGSQAGQGLYNGLSQWQASLSSLAWSIANNINTAARNALKIESPSRVMEETGLYVTEGLSEGLQMGTEDVMSSAEGMAQAVMGPSGRLIDGLSSKNVNDIFLDRTSMNDELRAALNSRAMDRIELSDAADDPRQIMRELGLIREAIMRLSEMQWVTDTGMLVGEMIEKIDNQLGAIQLQRMRN